MKSARTFLALLLVLGLSAWAQETPSPTPAEVPSEQPRATTEPSSQDLAEIRQELAELRAEIQQLRESMDLYLGKIVEQFQTENGLLRQEVGRLYELQPAPKAQATLDGARREQRIPGTPDLTQPAPEETENTGGAQYSVVEPTASPASEESTSRKLGDFTYTVVKEWGRTPEEAKNLGAEVSSLKGIIGVVPAGTPDKELLDFAHALRQEFDSYDNINIEFFDELDAANRYAETKVASPEHRILSVSKHRNSARDFILLIRGDLVTVVPWENSADSEPPVAGAAALPSNE